MLAQNELDFYANLCIVAPFAVILLVVMLVTIAVSNSRKREQAEEVAKKKEQAEWQTAHEARRAQEAAEKEQAEREAEKRAREDARERAEERAARRDQLATIQPKQLAAGGKLSNIDRAIRDFSLVRFAAGDYITAKCVGMPTGRFIIEWTVDGDRFDSPRVTVYRNKRKMIGSVGLSNQIAGQIWRGQSADFTLRLNDDEGDFVEKVEFELSIPTMEEWNDHVNAGRRKKKKPVDVAKVIAEEIEAGLAPQQAADKVRDAKFAELDANETLTEAEREDRKAGIDAAIAKVLDEHQK